MSRVSHSRSVESHKIMPVQWIFDTESGSQSSPCGTGIRGVGNVVSKKSFINRRLLISAESLSGTIREAAIK